MVQTTQPTWASGDGERKPGELNTRGWAHVDFTSALNGSCTRYESGCQCDDCLDIFNNDDRVLSIKLRAQHEGRKIDRTVSLTASTSPICASTPMDNLPPRISELTDHFDAVVTHLARQRGNTSTWLEGFSRGIADVQSGEHEPWEGRLLWAAVARDDFLSFAAPWSTVGSKIGQYLPDAQYPSSRVAGHRAPFVDVGLGSSLGFFWVLCLSWDTQFSAALTTSIAYWADMSSGPDAPKTGHALARIFDVLPSLALACTTGAHDNLSPMKALAIEYLRAPAIAPLPGTQLPSIDDVWLSRLADVGARESCVLMSSCPAAFSPDRTAQDTRCLVAWGVIHDLYDLPRDLASGNRVNAVLWALFAGFSGREVVDWLRGSVALAAAVCSNGGDGEDEESPGATSCAAKLLLCTAFVHVTNPRWGVNGLALSSVADWPEAPPLRRRRRGEATTASEELPLFSVGEPSHELCPRPRTRSPCICKSTREARSLGAATSNALNGEVAGFASIEERQDAHNAGMSALVRGDWEELVALSRVAWRTFLDDLECIADWVDGGR
ncbi:hypothetical protein BBP40_006528 [Aspergillus hancockii]|nr:hypothetical protein BBP40_006528 [Aspergillus hancockii]